MSLQGKVPWGWDSTHESLQGVKLETYLRGFSLTESHGCPFKQGNLGKDFQCTDIQRLLKLWSIDPNSWACNRTWHHLHNTNFACLQNEGVLVILGNCTNIFDKSLGSQAVYSRIRFSAGSGLCMKLSGRNPSVVENPRCWRCEEYEISAEESCSVVDFAQKECLCTIGIRA